MTAAPDLDALIECLRGRKFYDAFDDVETPDTLCQDAAAALASLREERDALKRHVAGHTPSIDKVRRMHSSMPASMFREGEGGHRVYTQNVDDACYLCTLLIEIQRLEAERDAAREALSAILDEEEVDGAHVIARAALAAREPKT